jgi:hypothetical protein
MFSRNECNAKWLAEKLISNGATLILRLVTDVRLSPTQEELEEANTRVTGKKLSLRGTRRSSSRA